MLGSKLDILKQEWIDVVFNGRNKNYGAYELRKSNPRNTSRALLYGVIFFVFVISLKTIINKIEGLIPKAEVKQKITDIVLTAPPVEKKKEIIPPKELPKPKTETKKFPPMVVKPDNEVVDEPPTQKELKIVDPGQKDQKGDPNAEIRIDEPVGNSDQKQVTEDANKVYTNLEVQPKFPGGDEKFLQYLHDNIKYPPGDMENNLQGTVNMQFVVEKDGTLTDIKTARTPISQAMADEAARVLKRSPKWTPGIQNGRPVRAYYNVPIKFSFE